MVLRSSNWIDAFDFAQLKRVAPSKLFKFKKEKHMLKYAPNSSMNLLGAMVTICSKKKIVFLMR